jgi:hypothetical protein
MHGDATVANALETEDGALVLCDPAPPRADLPSLRSIDEAAILQSLLGWEVHLWGIGPPEGYVWPWVELDDVQLTRMQWWMRHKCRRIRRYARGPEVEWLDKVEAVLG